MKYEYEEKKFVAGSIASTSLTLQYPCRKYFKIQSKQNIFTCLPTKPAAFLIAKYYYVGSSKFLEKDYR
jgi:hypothetical protein